MADREVLSTLGVNLIAIGPYMARIVDHDGPASYTTGGETITAAGLGFKRIISVMTSGADDGSAFCAVRHSVKKTQVSFRLQWYVATTGAEVANATNLSARFCRLQIIGIPS